MRWSLAGPPPDMTARYLTLILTLVTVAALMLIYHDLDLTQYLTLERLQGLRRLLLTRFRSAPRETVFLFMLAYMLVGAVALPGPLVMTLAAGAIFGVIPGAIYTSIAATAGASLVFAATRSIGHGLFLPSNQTLNRINHELERQGFWHLLFLRLVPIFPYTLINVAAALTTMPHATFLKATLVGVLLPNLVLANAGAQMGGITKTEDILTVRVIGSLALMGLVALTPILFRIRKRWVRPPRPD